MTFIHSEPKLCKSDWHSSLSWSSIAPKSNEVWPGMGFGAEVSGFGSRVANCSFEAPLDDWLFRLFIVFSKENELLYGSSRLPRYGQNCCRGYLMLARTGSHTKGGTPYIATG